MESFDVFDTVLTRIVGLPVSVFVVLGKKLTDKSMLSVSPVEFARLRVEAEARARHNCGGGEVTMEMIYHELGTFLGLSEAQRDRMMEWECETEELLLRAVPHAVEEVSEARSRHGRVIYVSDMYLQRSVIQKWLTQHGLWKAEDRLYLSNEAGVSKLSGRLFARILADECMLPKNLIHRGNHLRGDMSMPARIGIGVKPFPEGNLNRYETIMETQAASTGGLSSFMAGASRLARLSVGGTNKKERALSEVGAGVIAPLLTGYVLWILRRAQELALGRLYFLSRDGQILLEIARRLSVKLKMDIDLRYLYASRQSWHLPGITKIDTAKLEWICMKYDFLSIRSLLFRVGLVPDQVAEELEKIGLARPHWDRQLTPEEIERVKPLLREGPVHNLILSQAQTKRKMLTGYLRQEGVLEGVPWALIDVGWNGRLQASLAEVLHAEGGPVPHGFYFGLASRPPANRAGITEAYLFDHSGANPCLRISRVDYSTLMEIACAADHGTVAGFSERNGRVDRKLREERNTPVIEWGLPVMQKAICQFADHLVLDPGLVDLWGDLRPMSMDLIQAFWERPTQAEAEVWGRFPFENDQSGTGVRPIAEPYGLNAVIRALIGRKMGRKSVSFWQDGAIMISPPLIRAVLQCGMRMKGILRKPLQWVRHK